jgi:hypothetical protein
MKKADIEAALQRAFAECEHYFVPLTRRQKEILLQLVIAELLNSDPLQTADENPLDDLTPSERTALLDYIRDTEQANQSWKIKLFNDWLHGRDSGEVQFIRDTYGVQWLSQVQSVHVAQSAEKLQQEDALRLKVGDRVEVSNGLWEWVSKNDVCPEEWFPCTVIRLSQQPSNGSETFQNRISTTCTIRFDNGAEFEIQGVYQWNRYKWRWRKENQ